MNGFDAFLRLGAGPQVPTEVHIEGDDGSLRLETLDHLNGGCSQLGAQRQCNTTGMEATFSILVLISSSRSYINLKPFLLLLFQDFQTLLLFFLLIDL